MSAGTYYVRVFAFGTARSPVYYHLTVKRYDTAYGALNWSYFFADTSINYISSNYGPRTNDGRYDDHEGFDITTGVKDGIKGTPILSVTSGTVREVYLNLTEIGFAIAIETTFKDPLGTNNLWTTYEHMLEIPKKSNGTNWTLNDLVNVGDRLGLVGNTGGSSTYGYHLHFQVTRNGRSFPSGSYSNAVNPIYFFPSITFRGDTSIYNLSSLQRGEVEKADQETLLYEQLTNIDIRLVNYVGESLVLGWLTSSEEAKDLNDFRQKFGITDELFTELCNHFELNDYYDVAAIIALHSVK